MTAQQRDTIHATAPLAYHAITQHMIDRDLPAPGSIAVAVDRQSLQVHCIWQTDLAEWLDTLHIDDETSELIRGSLHTWYRGRLPDTGVRVTVTYVKLGLQSVSA